MGSEPSACFYGKEKFLPVYYPGNEAGFLSEEEIFVKKAPRRRLRPVREGYFLKSFGDLKENDFVVHTDFRHLVFIVDEKNYRG